MALGILVYENDLYLYSLIRERISSRFPGAYIERAGQEDQITDPRLLTDLCIVYDNRQFDPPDQGGAGRQIPLFADDGKGHSIIDMRRVIRQIGGERTSETVTELAAAAGTDRLRLLISFAYIDERENFINKVTGPSTFVSMHPVRIDLMSGIRMPAPLIPGGTGSITKLLRDSTGKRFDPSSIPDYLNPDGSGFLSAGRPDNDDDVFDIGADVCAGLIKMIRDMCIREDTGALVAVEGWRMSELTEFIKICDTLHILLPARMCTEDTGMVKELGRFKRSLRSGALMTVHYCEDYKDQYEAVSI